MQDKPYHIAVMMDGNGRWAKKRFLPVKAGHHAGGQALRKLAEAMNKNIEADGVRILTVFAFSTENWARPAEEVAALMDLLRQFIKEYIDGAANNNMRISVIGDTAKLDSDIRESINDLTEKTKGHTGLHVNIAINYGGRDDIVRAARKIAAEAAEGKLGAADIDERVFAGYLDTYAIPDPDLFIRTGGDLRISNFMLWQMAYTEFYICGKLWPDFEYGDLREAADSFGKRERRFGGRA